VEASCSLGQDLIGWKQSETTGETIYETGVVRLFAHTNNGILGGNDQALDMKNTENDFEMQSEVEERKLQQMAKVHNILKTLEASQSPRVTQEASYSQTSR
jgi:hypothetical protein